jgi:hypothetical protein
VARDRVMMAKVCEYARASAGGNSRGGKVLLRCRTSNSEISPELGVVILRPPFAE